MLPLSKLFERKSSQYRLAAYFSPSSKAADQYRAIRTNLQLNPETKNIKSIIVTSPGLKEGKTATSVNMAISFSKLGKKVLLIDGDSKNPVMHETFQMDNTAGLSDILRGELEFEEAIASTGIGRLEIMTSGTIKFNHSEMLAATAFSRMMKKAEKEYDYVIVDAPPLLETADVNIMANECEGLILVARAGKTEQSKLAEAKKKLGSFDVRALGVVLTRAK